MEKISTTTNWSVEWDNKPVLLLVMQKPKMTYGEIIDVIKAEGGYVDSEGIIHKGTAENKVYTLDKQIGESLSLFKQGVYYDK